MLLGTQTLAVLAGSRRYPHVTALRGDTVNPQGLGMSRVLSEDALRRAVQDEAAGPLETWQRQHLHHSVEPALRAPWICDVDVTIKTLYGHQERAAVGYNPHKVGRGEGEPNTNTGLAERDCSGSIRVFRKKPHEKRPDPAAA